MSVPYSIGHFVEDFIGDKFDPEFNDILREVYKGVAETLNKDNPDVVDNIIKFLDWVPIKFPAVENISDLKGGNWNPKNIYKIKYSEENTAYFQIIEEQDEFFNYKVLGHTHSSEGICLNAYESYGVMRHTLPVGMEIEWDSYKVKKISYDLFLQEIKVLKSGYLNKFAIRDLLTPKDYSELSEIFTVEKIPVIPNRVYSYTISEKMPYDSLVYINQDLQVEILASHSTEIGEPFPLEVRKLHPYPISDLDIQEILKGVNYKYRNGPFIDSILNPTPFAFSWGVGLSILTGSLLAKILDKKYLKETKISGELNADETSNSSQN